MEKNDITSISLYDLLSNFMTEKELAEIDFLNLSPEFILECFRETPGILNIAYLGNSKFAIDSSIAGKFEIEISIKDQIDISH